MTEHKTHHHILPVKMALTIFGTLLVLTWFTVFIAGIDLGPLNLLVAVLVATVKATLVGLFFMGLLYDKRENSVIFGASFLFLIIFVVLTMTDLYFRGDVYVKGPLLAAAPSGQARFKKAWEPRPELVAHGQSLFAGQCAACHGPEGRGDGPAAGSMNPPPRNFHNADGWKNGLKPSEIFKTLKEGLPGTSMASFGSLPAEDRWALSHYVNSLTPTQPKDSTQDLAKIGVDPTKEDAGAEKVAPTIPIDFAMERLAN